MEKSDHLLYGQARFTEHTNLPTVPQTYLRIFFSRDSVLLPVQTRYRWWWPMIALIGLLAPVDRPTGWVGSGAVLGVCWLIDLIYWMCDLRLLWWLDQAAGGVRRRMSFINRLARTSTTHWKAGNLERGCGTTEYKKGLCFYVNYSVLAYNDWSNNRNCLFLGNW